MLREVVAPGATVGVMVEEALALLWTRLPLEPLGLPLGPCGRQPDKMDPTLRELAR